LGKLANVFIRSAQENSNAFKANQAKLTNKNAQADAYKSTDLK
jgi:hypothetical protein